MVRTTLASIKNPESWNLEKAKKKKVPMAEWITSINATVWSKPG